MDVLGEAEAWPVWTSSSLLLSLLSRLCLQGAPCLTSEDFPWKSNEQPFQLPIHLRASSSKKPSEINPSCL